MSDEVVQTKPLGFLSDPNGDLSSGRLIKIIAMITASLMGLGCVAALFFAGTDIEKIKVIGGIIAGFLAISGVAEVTQKALGK